MIVWHKNSDYQAYLMDLLAKSDDFLYTGNRSLTFQLFDQKWSNKSQILSMLRQLFTGLTHMDVLRRVW